MAQPRFLSVAILLTLDDGQGQMKIFMVVLRVQEALRVSASHYIYSHRHSGLEGVLKVT